MTQSTPTNSLGEIVLDTPRRSRSWDATEAVARAAYIDRPWDV